MYNTCIRHVVDFRGGGDTFWARDLTFHGPMGLHLPIYFPTISMTKIRPWQMIVRFALFDRLFLPFVAETGPKFWDSSDTWARQCCFGCCKDITETCQHVGGIKWEKGRNYSWRVIHAGLSKRAGGCYEVYYRLLSLNYTVHSSRF